MQKTWKVLIADDEPIIREGIREAINWEALQMEVVAEAEDGEEALELVLEHSVDILLADLNMPIMNGITLIKNLREKRPQCKIVIITGHDEFTYAQEAVRLHVTDYILKPANPEQLKNLLENIRKELEATAQQDDYLKMAETQITKNFPLLQERFCLEWIEGHMKEAEILEQLRFLQLPAECPQQFGIIHCPEFYTTTPLVKENDRKMLLFSIENIVSELLQPFQKVLFCDHSGLIIVCVWAHVPTDTLFEIEKAVKEYLRVTVNLYFEPIQDGLTAITELYQRCKGLVDKESRISPMVRRAKKFIHDHFSDPDLTLELLAQSLQASPVYLSRTIKQELGRSFVGLVTELRMKKAIQLLNDTDLSILEIAERVGYDTQHYFSTAFKKVMGVSPNQYRKGSGFLYDEPIRKELTVTIDKKIAHNIEG
ncbi:response regulator transcription factor [Ectobacillus funiculus]|uniref:response regulator transcription factor n=1 Tax=Ectobacillus funiculus TaxID=137993 RepID=UPI00101C90F2|nr:response regulator [Ectobacillus funiculus]